MGIVRDSSFSKVSKCFSLDTRKNRRPDKVEMICNILKPEQTIYMAINYMGKKMQLRSHKIYLMSKCRRRYHTTMPVRGKCSTN